MCLRKTREKCCGVLNPTRAATCDILSSVDSSSCRAWSNLHRCKYSINVRPVAARTLLDTVSKLRPKRLATSARLLMAVACWPI